MKDAKLLHYSHCVSDIERSRTFYVEVLGFEVVAEFDFDDAATARVMGLPGARFKGVFMKRDGMRIGAVTGVQGISEQDACIQDSQGLIYDRTKEHLGTTDVAIIEFRRMMLRMARNLLEGQEPAEARNGRAYWVRSGAEVAPRTTPFAEVAADRTAAGESGS